MEQMINSLLLRFSDPHFHNTKTIMGLVWLTVQCRLRTVETISAQAAGDMQEDEKACFIHKVASGDVVERDKSLATRRKNRRAEQQKHSIPCAFSVID
jgi:hypothetical protein